MQNNHNINHEGNVTMDVDEGSSNTGDIEQECDDQDREETDESQSSSSEEESIGSSSDEEDQPFLAEKPTSTKSDYVSDDSGFFMGD